MKLQKQCFQNVLLCLGSGKLTHILKHIINLKIAVATTLAENYIKVKINHIKDWLNEDIDKMICGDDKKMKNGKPTLIFFISYSRVRCK